MAVSAVQRLDLLACTLPSGTKENAKAHKRCLRIEETPMSLLQNPNLICFWYKPENGFFNRMTGCKGFTGKGLSAV